MYSCFWGVVCGAAVVFGLAFVAAAKEKSRPVEKLKNALLSLALMRTKPGDRDDFSMDYAAFDGTKLPMFSGCDLANAAFTYILDIGEFRRGPFYTAHMEHKHRAVERYIERNLSTRSAVYAFFKDFVATIPEDVDNGIVHGMEWKRVFDDPSDKAKEIEEFLLADDDGEPCLVVIGGGGTGKTTALQAALKAVPDNHELNVIVWNHGELPAFARFNYPSAPTKWVVFRHKADRLVDALLEEWGSGGRRCRRCLFA